jgi:hypothetical protein
MKKLRLIGLVICLLMTNNVLFAQQKVTLNALQQSAQKSIVKTLKAKKIEPKIDINDESVCFTKDNVFYWITFEGEDSPLLYTIHRKSIKFAEDDDAKLNHKKEIAEKAANMVTAEETFKAYLADNKVEFSFPFYVNSEEEFANVIDKSLVAFADAKKSFDEKYKISKEVTDTIHSYWNHLDTTIVVLPQEQEIVTEVETPNVTIEDFAVRIVDKNGNELVGYNKSIRKNECKYLQEKVMTIATKPGIYKLGVKIYTPEGKLLVPTPDAKFTTLTKVELNKSTRSTEVELAKFGTDDLGWWKAGEYKIEFYDGEVMVYSNSINVL